METAGLKRFVIFLLILHICCFIITLAYSESATAKLAEKYAEAELLLVEGHYDEAASAFDALGSYSDSSKMAMYCKAISSAENEQMAVYYTGRYGEDIGDAYLNNLSNCTDNELINAKKSFDTAKQAYSELMLYKDSLARVSSCQDKIDQISAEQNRRITEKNEPIYQAALKMEEQGQWMEAVIEYKKIKEYKDSAQRIQLCTNAYKESRYNSGIEYREAEEWDASKQAFRDAGDYKDASTQISITTYEEGMSNRAAQKWDAAIKAFESIADYKDSKVQVLETKYQQAAALYDSEQYEDSLSIYEQILFYEDVRTILEKDEKLVETSRKKLLNGLKRVGEYVRFGSYEQDNDTSTGKEAVEWLVLDVQGSKTLVISRYVLDVKQFDSREKKVTWENSSIRSWLNGEFLNSTFSNQEQNAIFTASIDNSKAQGNYDNDKNTKDKIFFLSDVEANKKYFSTNDSRLCAPTDYAIAHGAFASDRQKEEGHVNWWLRSIGKDGDDAAATKFNGITSFGFSPTYELGIRPSLWIDLDSSFFK